ncbi:hypothetical protein [Streptomyces sp. NPDC002328]|uniref:hypothetical protein n=1 Tax=Streptomyces sp. NPDC002328 TaxID=3364642 RepID=UPI0036BCB0B5
MAHLAAVRERLWAAASLLPWTVEAGFEVIESIPAVPRDDASGRIDAEILVLTPE